MHPLLILLLGILVVIGGILLLRLHAFLALILGALVVGLLTPADNVQRALADKAALPFELPAGDSPGPIRLAANPAATPPGSRLLILRPDAAGGLAEAGEMEVAARQAASSTGAEAKAGLTLQAVAGTLEADDLLLLPADWVAAQQSARETIGERVASAFGATCGKVGILIAMAAIIGKCLLDSGAADRIVRSALTVTGQRGAPFAFLGSGFLLGIPVFFDTVFYLMMPLGKAMRLRTGRNYLLYVLTIVAGGSMAHSLVPPTPGPLQVAAELGVDVGILIVAGCLVGSVASLAATCYAYAVNARYELPLRESPDFSLAEMEAIAAKSDRELPPLIPSLLPIVLPVILIAGATLFKSLDWYAQIPPAAAQVVKSLGNRNIALTISAAIAMGLLLWQRGRPLADFAKGMQDALASGGVIILITSAGGAFGGMLQQSGVIGLIRQLDRQPTLVILCLAFLVTTGIRTAQGSATVAMITAAGILAGFASRDALGCHPVFLALAIGCGSKPIAWMNDSGFWVICKLSGMTEAEGLRYVTPMSILMGVSGLIATLLGAAFVRI